MLKKGITSAKKEATKISVEFNTEQRLNFSSKLGKDEIQLILPQEYAEFFTQSKTGQINETARQLVYGIISTLKRIRLNYISKADKGVRINANPYVPVAVCSECGYELFIPKAMVEDTVVEASEEVKAPKETKTKKAEPKPVIKEEVVETPIIEEPIADEGNTPEG